MQLLNTLANRIKQLFSTLLGRHSTAPQSQAPSTDSERRQLLGGIGGAMVGTGVLAIGAAQQANAHALPKPETSPEDWFPGDPPLYGMIYQLNQSDNDYHEHVLNSVGAMVAKYEGRAHLVVVCFGRGIHVLAKNPERPVSEYIQSKVESLAKQGVEFQACGRTMDSLKWTADDMLPIAKIVQVGASSVMELQLKNYAYLAW